jgi:transglycosylase-like protein
MWASSRLGRMRSRAVGRLIAAALCAGALVAGATVPAAASDGGGGGTTTAATTTAKSAVPAPPRFRAAYRHWRRRLVRHRIYVGRNLLERRAGEAVAAGTNTVTKAELRHSIHRMQRRWGHWLRTPRGRVIAFKLKVRRQVPGWGRAQLRSIAWCESKNDPQAIGGGGAYRGMYQFSFSTWAVVGGSGDPAAASSWEQTWRAWLLLSRHGSGHWPVCG